MKDSCDLAMTKFGQSYIFIQILGKCGILSRNWDPFTRWSWGNLKPRPNLQKDKEDESAA